MRDFELANLMVDYASTFFGTPYCWGGDDFSSLDCSGLVIECLKAVGKFPEKGDTTANGLYHMFRGDSNEDVIEESSRGCLVFFFKNDKATHVGIYVGKGLYITADGKGLYITADGGNSKTISESVAIEQNAFVKLRPVRMNPVYVDPFRGEE